MLRVTCRVRRPASKSSLGFGCCSPIREHLRRRARVPGGLGPSRRWACGALLQVLPRPWPVISMAGCRPWWNVRWAAAKWCISPGMPGLAYWKSSSQTKDGLPVGFSDSIRSWITLPVTGGERLIVGHGRPPDDRDSDADLLGWNCGHTPQLERRASAGGPGGCSERQERRKCGERAAWKAAIRICGRSYSFRSASGKRDIVTLR